MVEPIAGIHRGAKNIPFEDLCASGAEGLVKAARTWRGEGDFRGYAYVRIDGEIKHFIRDWQDLETVGLLNAEEDEKYYTWSIYQTPYEGWEKLAATPEEIVARWEEMRDARNALSGAMISLSKRDRAILEARFIREPNQSLPSIARDHKISYARVVFLIDRSLKKLRKILERQDENRKGITPLSSLAAGKA